MKPYWQRRGITVYQGDNVEVMRSMPDNSIDTIFTDPPYALEFMGKGWDKVLPAIETWVECLRVAKPGAMLMAFGGTRTYHRLTCSIEDAGWEIRDCVMFLYGSGFPKSHNWPIKLHEMACAWHGYMVKYDYEETQPDIIAMEGATASTTRGEPEAKHRMRFVQASYLSEAVYACAECSQVLQPFMPQQNLQEHRAAWAKSEIVWPEQPSMEGRRNVETTARKLSRCEVCTLSGRPLADGAEGRLSNGASNGHGAPPWAITEEDGDCTSYRPQSLEQLHREPDAVSVERSAQTSRGYGTALKPAYEPIVLAMKPLDGTFAENAQKWGVAGLWIDGGRIETEEIVTEKHLAFKGQKNVYGEFGESLRHSGTGTSHPAGRWPANVILTHHPECVLRGEKKVSGSQKPGSFQRVKTSKGLKGGGYGQEKASMRDKTDLQKMGYADAEGLEIVEDWDCYPDCPVRMLDEQSGELTSGANPTSRSSAKTKDIYGEFEGQKECIAHRGADSGSASRFFYTAKASRAERNAGLGSGYEAAVKHDARPGDCEHADWPKRNGNYHPTVKPLALVDYLMKLVSTPTGGVVLDPFMGSGTTLLAAQNRGRKAIGVELEQEYCEIAKRRLMQPLLDLTG